ncbi:hypothetical protein KKE45_01045 [Patescibacteria group bacterium]|nr:hypothetical protein [Patescibacteria group bacterium]
MKKNKISKYFLFISSFTLLSIFILIIQKSYSNLIGPSQQLETSSLMRKIDPNLDIDTLRNVERQKEFMTIPITSPSIVSSPSSTPKLESEITNE